jgi:hypothetical protein
VAQSAAAAGARLPAHDDPLPRARPGPGAALRPGPRPAPRSAPAT